MATANKTTNPSIHAVFLLSSSEVPTSMAIETMLAMMSILSMKSSSASLKSWQNEERGA